MRTSLRAARATSTGSKTSGRSQRGGLAKFNGCASDKFVLLLKECALATKFQAMAVQPQARELALAGQKLVPL